MANLIDGTVVNIGGNPIQVPQTQTFPTGLIFMSATTVASSPAAVTLIKYMYGPFSNQEYFVSETVADLLTAANTGTTSMVGVTVLAINANPQRSAVSYAFPASQIILRSVSDGDVNCIVSFGNNSYAVSETEASIVSAANAGGGGGGDAWLLASGGTLTGDNEIEVGDNTVEFTGVEGNFYSQFIDATDYASININKTSIQLGAGSAVDEDLYQSFELDSDGTGRWKANSATATANVKMTTHGLENAADYSADFAARSLVDKAYVDKAKYNVQVGTSYSLQDSDNGKVVTLNNGSGITLTVPAGLAAGFNCSLVQLGAGQVTITPASTTVHNRNSFTKIAGQYGMATLLMYTTDTFVSQGDTA